MCRILAVVFVVLFGSGGMFCTIKWPDNNIAVPHLVLQYIHAECWDYAGTTLETVNECLAAERSGYQATVMMLQDRESGQKAAERYRACAAGLGSFGGRFHRRRAECIGRSFRYIWRFEDTERA